MSLLQLTIRGLEIDAQCGKGGVVNLVVRADKQHKGNWRRLRQHIAYALFRIGDACYPGDDHGSLRVILRNMGRTSLDDGLPHNADTHIRQVWPIHTANGDAHYMALLIHEGVKRHQDGKSAIRKTGLFRRQRCTDNAHELAPVNICLANVTEVAGAE